MKIPVINRRYQASLPETAFFWKRTAQFAGNTVFWETNNKLSTVSILTNWTKVVGEDTDQGQEAGGEMKKKLCVFAPSWPKKCGVYRGLHHQKTGFTNLTPFEK